MDEQKATGLHRSAVLLAVLALHIALIAAILGASRTLSLPAAAHSVELLYLAPAPPPKADSSVFLPRRLNAANPNTIAAPDLDSLAMPPSASLSYGSAPGPGGRGSGVDWAAEAHRAIQAFEIRGHQPKNGASVSGLPGEEHWWPRTRHHAGEQFKTAKGDWIVWIDADCYQVATSGPSLFAPGATLPQTICLSESGTAR